jgi:acetyl-CoA carboxylase biotin carboxyl carrier protein
VVGIIETMKLMTAVHAGVRGTIAEIAVENAQFADQGTVLMTIKPEPA